MLLFKIKSYLASNIKLFKYIYNHKQNTFEVQNDSIENKIDNNNETMNLQPTLVINLTEEKPELTNNEDFESSYL